MRCLHGVGWVDVSEREKERETNKKLSLLAYRKA